MKHFSNGNVFTQGWYPAMRLHALHRGTAKTIDFLGRPITFFRTPDGIPHALDARCPHLGADLGLGSVSGEGVRCWFHGWTFDGEGRCTSRPSVSAVAYPVQQRYGFLWLFNGPVALFPLPLCDGHALRLPAQIIRSHPHLVAGNGFDTSHFASMHEILFLDQPQLEQPDRFHTRLVMRIRFEGRGLAARLLRAAGGADVKAAFTTHGANLATIEAAIGRTPVRVLFSHTPLADGSSRSQTIVFPQTVTATPLVIATVIRIVAGDRRLLDRLDFQPNLTENDWAFAAFMRQVEEMPLFPGRETRSAEWRGELVGR